MMNGKIVPEITYLCDDFSKILRKKLFENDDNVATDLEDLENILKNSILLISKYKSD